jgi:hypothetical protein
MLYLLSHTPSPFCFSYCFNRLWSFCLGWPGPWSSYVDLPHSWEDRWYINLSSLLVDTMNFSPELAWNCEFSWALPPMSNPYFHVIFPERMIRNRGPNTLSYGKENLITVNLIFQCYLRSPVSFLAIILCCFLLTKEDALSSRFYIYWSEKQIYVSQEKKILPSKLLKLSHFSTQLSSQSLNTLRDNYTYVVYTYICLYVCDIN